jgi:hypothetical protein
VSGEIVAEHLRVLRADTRQFYSELQAIGPSYHCSLDEDRLSGVREKDPYG